MGKFSVHYNPDDMSNIPDYSPFNLKRDIKTISKNMPAKTFNEIFENLLEEIGIELYKGTERPPLITTPHWDESRNFGWTKLRVGDSGNNTGKSGGYRCILLVDKILKRGYLLHIYKHGNTADENMNHKTKKKLKKLVDVYAKSMEAYNLI